MKSKSSFVLFAFVLYTLSCMSAPVSKTSAGNPIVEKEKKVFTGDAELDRCLSRLSIQKKRVLIDAYDLIKSGYSNVQLVKQDTSASRLAIYLKVLCFQRSGKANSALVNVYIYCKERNVDILVLY